MEQDTLKYKIIGDDIQLVEIELAPEQTLVCEAGAMVYMDDKISFDTKLGDGSSPNQGIFDKIASATSRFMTSESIFMTHFTNDHHEPAIVAFAAPYPGKILHINLSKIQGEITCQKDSFLCAAAGTKLSVAFTKKFTSGFFGKEGFILQKLTGNNSVFIHACGSIVRKKLENQSIYVESGCLVAFTKGIDYSVQMYGGIKSMLFGKEGLFVTKLSGTGYVWLQSLPFDKLAGRIARYVPVYQPPK